MNSSTTSPFTSLALKLVGIILIISSLVDYLVLLIPFQIQDRDWQINLTGQLVDRGVVPLVGIGLLLIGYWIDTLANTSNISQKSGLDLRMPAFIVASFLGLVFLLLVPVHLNNLRYVSSNALTQIQQGTDQVENKIKAEFEQLNAIAQDPKQLQDLETKIQEIDKAINSGQVQGQALNPQQIQQLIETKKQMQGIRDAAKDPKVLKQKLNESLTKFRDRKLADENKAKTDALKQGLRIGISSLMLSVGYIVIGWFGLKEMGSTMGGKRKAKGKG